MHELYRTNAALAKRGTSGKVFLGTPHVMYFVHNHVFRTTILHFAPEFVKLASLVLFTRGLVTLGRKTLGKTLKFY